MYPYFYRSLIFPAYHALKSDGMNKALSYARKHVKTPEQELVTLQRSKLLSLMRHARQHVPYYQALLSDTWDDEALLSAFANLPALTKSVIRQQGQNMLTPVEYRCTPLIANSTGGSTGETLEFYNDGHSHVCGSATTMREYEMLGIHMGERFAQLWGAPMDIGRSSSLRGRVHAVITRRLFLSTYQLSAEDMERYYQSITRFKPAMMISYPSSMAHFCEYLESTGRTFTSLRAVVVSAETLFPWQRELIERIAGCPVYNRYGSREFGNMAIELKEHQGLYIETDRVILELLDDEMRPVSAGETGHVHVTDLDNTGMPFIRYRIGDMASGMETNNWRNAIGWSRLASVEGRSFDVVKAPNGNNIGGTFWTLLLRARPGIRKFQVRQISSEELVIDYVPEAQGHGLPKDSRDYWIGQIIDMCGSKIQVEFNCVAEITTSKSGKSRIVVSEVS